MSNDRVITNGPISESDLIPNTVIEVAGKWFCIHGFHDGQVLYARGDVGTLVGDLAGRMDTAKFIAGINDALAVPPAAPAFEDATAVVAARKQDDEDLQQEMERDWESRD